MVALVSHSTDVSGWEIAAAVGTILGAAATVAAVVAALMTGVKDRRAAQDAIDNQMRRADDRRRREHEVDLLLRLTELVAAVHQRPSSGQQGEARIQGRALVQALPDVSRMPAVRDMFGSARFTWARSPSLEDVHGEHASDSPVDLAIDEIAMRMSEVAE